MRILSTLLALATTLCATACTNNKTTDTMKQTETNGRGRVLVAFYSRTGENYGVGNITKGNTHIIAEMIAEATGGELFEIKPVKEYPADYTECTEVAQEERSAGARPDIKADHDIADYDTIYIGYPIWWGDAPMPVYTWIDRHEWTGKVVIPFCTHEGSGLGSSPSYIGQACKGATVGRGLAVQGTVAQRQQARAKKLVEDWLAK